MFSVIVGLATSLHLKLLTNEARILQIYDNLPALVAVVMTNKDKFE